MPLAAVIALIVLLLSSPALAENFLVIVADDLGVDGVAVYSRDDLYGHPGEGANPGPTPHIDQLAAEGVLFRYAYANSQCAPTRAATLTGRHGFRTGIGTPGGAFLDPAETTLPEILAPSHATAAIGKWHLGGIDIDHPIASGFGYYAGRLANLSDYYSWSKTTNSPTTAGSTQDGFPTYVTTDNADEAIAKISEFGGGPRGSSGWPSMPPILPSTFLPTHSPPSPSTATPTARPSSRPPSRPWIRRSGAYSRACPGLSSTRRRFIFLGDNGTPGNVTGPSVDSSRAKETLYEGGIRVPFIVKSPRVSSSDRGAENLALINSTDVFATVAELAGVAASAEDSVSIIPHLENPALGTQRRCVYAENFSPNGAGPYSDERRAARNDTYKLIWRNGSYEEFFDLAVDPWELNNLLPVSGLESAADAGLRHACRRHGERHLRGVRRRDRSGTQPGHDRDSGSRARGAGRGRIPAAKLPARRCSSLPTRNPLAYRRPRVPGRGRTHPVTASQSV